ncbi:hypothetical protein O3Q52_36235 [Streptomyces sp. ActVer]|uniref:hypothetical protein n=1 Tax=Streptomyces sp. ActVer TaxID=3014558 RepID=UPI0022B4D742|nr:hypothetical protein [Streptomyces sp. ActVer]MCZ4513504.1 hypothetical protein [Streptomyces sp. ActVer]
MNSTPEPQTTTDPVCKFEEGCHRVEGCDPGCAVDAARMHAQLAAVPPVQERRDRYAALAEDLRYVFSYNGPPHAHEKPGVWDTSGKPCGHCARLAVAQRNLAAYDADPDAVLAVADAEQAELRAAVDTSEDRCAECGHFRGAHEDAEEPVSVGRCTVCADDDERHDFEAAVELHHAAAVLPQPETQAGHDLPERLEAALTERFTELGNRFSRMSRTEKGPDGWPASHPVGPHHVAEVLRELLHRTADEEPEPRLPDHTVNEEETPPTTAPAVVSQPDEEAYVPTLHGAAELEEKLDIDVSPAAVLLSTRCDACRHTLNWHRNDIGCTVALCVCGRFQPPAEEPSP